jgi:hypothetical protein
MSHRLDNCKLQKKRRHLLQDFQLMEQTLLQAFQSANILSWMTWQCRHALKRHNSECKSCITLLAEENSFSCYVVVVAATAAIIQFDFQSFIFYIHLGRKFFFPHSLLHSGIKGFNSITFLSISVSLAAKFYHCISLTIAILITPSLNILTVFASFSHLWQF